MILILKYQTYCNIIQMCLKLGVGIVTESFC